MKQLALLIAGILLGALSWGIAYAVSGKFEPFDSGSGFFTTQIILSSAALVVGIRRGILAAVILVSGSYLGMNAYAFALGGPDAKAWMLLGLMTTVALVLVPALAGLIGGAAIHVLARLRQRRAKSD